MKRRNYSQVVNISDSDGNIVTIVMQDTGGNHIETTIYREKAVSLRAVRHLLLLAAYAADWSGRVGEAVNSALVIGAGELLSSGHEGFGDWEVDPSDDFPF